MPETPMDKAEKKRLKAEFKRREREALRASIPMPIDALKDLFRYVARKSASSGNAIPYSRWSAHRYVLCPQSPSSPRLRAEEWRLMGREGGCATLAEAADRLPLLRGIATPDQLVAELRRQGEDVNRQDIPQGDVTVVLVEAPGHDLSLIFVPPSLCR